MKVLALDVGSAQVKCAILETKFGRFDIVFHDVIPVADALQDFPQDAQLSPGQLQALRQIAERHAPRVDKVVMNLPLSLYNTRLLTFPFSDKKKLRNAVQFAIEDEIPFNVEDCTISSQFMPAKKSKETAVLVGIAPNNSLEALVHAVQGAGLDPEILTIDPAGLWSLMARHKSTYGGKGVAIINLGHRKSQLFLFRDCEPTLMRTTMVGGYHVSAAIAKRYEIGLAEAEVVKIDRAFLPAPGMQLTNDQKIFAETVVSALDPVFHDLDQALMAYSSRYQESVQQIFITGGTSRMPGLAEMLAARWNQAVRPFSLLSHLPNLSVRPDATMEASLATAACLSLTQVSSDYKSTINFRTGKFKSQSRGPSIQWQQFIRPLKLAGVVYFFALLSFLGQSFLLQQQLEAVSVRHDQALQEIFGKSSQSFLAGLKASESKLKQAVNKKVEELSAQLAGGSDVPTLPTLDVLDNLSRSIPKGTTVEIREMQLTNQTLSMKLEAPAQRDIDSVLRLLGSVPGLGALQPGAVETLPGGRKKVSVNMKVTQKGGGA